MPPVKTPPIKEKERRKLAKIRRGQKRRIDPGGKTVTVTPKKKQPSFGAPIGRNVPGVTTGKADTKRPKPPRKTRVRPGPTFQGTGAEAEARKVPPRVTRALDRAERGPGGSLIVKTKADLHAINQYARDQARARKSVRVYNRNIEAQERMWRKRARQLKGAQVLEPLAFGGRTYFPNLEQRISTPFVRGKLDFKRRPGAEFVETRKGFITTGKGAAQLRRRAMTPAQREAYDKANRAATIQAGLFVATAGVPGPGMLLRAGAAAALGGKLGVAGAKFAGRALQGRSGTAAALRGAQRKVVLAGGGKKVAGQVAKGAAISAAKTPLVLARHPVRAAVLSPLLVEAGTALPKGKAPNIQAGLSGTGQLAALTTKVQGGGHGVVGTLANFGADLVNLPAQVIPSVYLPIAAAIAAVKGDDDRWDQLVEEFKKYDPAGALILGGDPAAAIKAFQQHPLYGILEGLGAYGAAGRGVGGGLRRGVGGERGKRYASLEAGPLLGKGEMSLPGVRYSPNIITQKLIQEPMRRRQEARVAQGKRPYLLPERVRHPITGSKVMTAGANMHDQMVSAWGGALRSHINDVHEEAVKVWGKANMDDTMEAVSRIAEGTVQDRRIIQDAAELAAEWRAIRNDPDTDWSPAQLELIDRNIRAMDMLQDPRVAQAALDAARAFRETQTEADLALMQQDKTTAMRQLRRREIPWQVMHNNVEWVPDDAMPGGGSFMQRVFDDDEGDGGGRGPEDGGPEPDGPSLAERAYQAEEEATAALMGDRKMTPEEKRAFVDEEAQDLLGVSGEEALRRGWIDEEGFLTPEGQFMRELREIDSGEGTIKAGRKGERTTPGGPSIRDRVQNAFGPLMPTEGRGPELIDKMTRRNELGGGRMDIESFGRLRRAMREGRLRDADLDELMADPEFMAFIEELRMMDPDEGPDIAQAVIDAYRLDTEDPLIPWRDTTPEERDRQYMELAGKSDEQIKKDLEDIFGGKSKDPDDEGGGLGLKDKDDAPDAPDPREVQRILHEGHDLLREVQEVVFDENRQPPFEPSDELTLAHDAVQGARMAWDATKDPDVLRALEAAIEDLRDIWNDERPMTQDEIAYYFHEVEQRPEANRREPTPNQKAAREREGITHEEFMEHYESRKDLGAGRYDETEATARLGEGDSAKAVNMEFLNAFIQGMMDPFKTEQWGQMAQRLAKEFTDRGEHISWATIRIAESLGNYHPWLKPLSIEKWNEYHRMETGEPVLGAPDIRRLQRVIDELEFESSLPEANQNPSYIARLVRQVAEASHDPTYRQIEGLPEVNRAPVIERLKETIDEAKESLAFHEAAVSSPDHPLNGEWRAVHNAMLRAERAAKEGDADPSLVAELERRIQDLEDADTTLMEVGGGDFGVGAPKSPRKMDLDELRQERDDLIDELRAAEHEGRKDLADEVRENLAEVNEQIEFRKRERRITGKSEPEPGGISQEQIDTIREFSTREGADLGKEFLRKLPEEELLSMWDEIENVLDDAAGMSAQEIKRLDRAQRQIIEVLQERDSKMADNLPKPMGGSKAARETAKQFNEPTYTGDERARVEKEAGDALKNEFGDVTPPPTPRGNTADQAYRVENGQYVSNDPNAPVKYYRVTHDNGDVRLQWARSETEALHRSTWGVNGTSKAIKAEKAGPEQTQGLGPPYTPGDPLPPTQVPSDVRHANLRSEEVMGRELDSLAEALDERGHTDLYDRLTDQIADYMQGRKGADETRLEAARIESESIKRLQSEGSQTPPPGAGGPPGGGKGGGPSGGGGGGRVPPMKPTPSGGAGGKSRLVPISTAEMIRQRLAAGQEDVAYVSHALEGAGRAVERSLEQPATFRSKALHAEALVSGQAPGTMGTLVRSVTKAVGYANKIGLHREITRVFGVKAKGDAEATIFPDEKAALEAIEQKPDEYDLSGKPGDYKAVPAPPPKADIQSMNDLRAAVEATNPDAFDLDIFDSIEDFNKSLHTAKNAQHGVILVRKEIAKRYEELTAKPRTLENAFAAYQSIFKSAVLPTSTKWLAGNLFDVSIRALIGGLLPPGLVYMSDNYRVGKALFQTMQRIDPEAARRFLSGPLQGTHFSSQEAAIQHIKDVNEWAEKDLHPLLDMIVNDKGSPIRWYKGYRDTVFKFNSKFIEQTPLFAMLGKVAKADIRARMTSWHEVMKKGDAAIEDVARGLLKTENQVRYATEFSKLFGDWGRLRPNEKQFLINYAPFYLWARASARFVLITLPRDHPVFTGLVAAAQGMTDEERKRLGFDLLRASAITEGGTGFSRQAKGRPSPVPNFLQGGIVTPSGDYKGLAYSTSFGVFNDYPNTLANFILPQASGALQAAAGLDFTGDTITRPDGSKANVAEKAALVAYFLFEPLVPFAAMARSIYRADRTPSGVSPFGYKGKRGKTLDVLGHTLIPSPIPGSKSYDPNLVKFLREKEGNLYQIWVPLKQAPKGFGGGRGGGFGGSGRGSKGFKRAGE